MASTPVDVTDELVEVVYPGTMHAVRKYHYYGTHGYFIEEDATYLWGSRLRNRRLEQHVPETDMWRDVTEECVVDQNAHGSTQLSHHGEVQCWCYPPYAISLDQGRLTITRIPKISYAEALR